MAMVEMGARVLRDELVNEPLSGQRGRLRDLGYAVHRVRVDRSMKVDRVREVMRILQNNANPVALFDADGWARQPRDRRHACGDGRENPERKHLARGNFLHDFNDLEPQLDLVRIAVPVKVSTERYGVVRHSARCLEFFRQDRHAGKAQNRAKQNAPKGIRHESQTVPARRATHHKVSTHDHACLFIFPCT